MKGPQTCGTCSGTGVEDVVIVMPGGGRVPATKVCSDCQGSGVR